MTTSLYKTQALEYQAVAMTWHEAAHTICGLYNFMHVYFVCIMSNKHEDGNTLYEIYDTDSINNKMLAKILHIYEVQTLYAGLVGEKIYYKDICGSDKFPMHLRIGSSDDIKTAAKIIAKNNLAEPGRNRFIFKKQIQNDTRNILLHYWSDIKLISHVLYRYKELEEDELKYYLTRKSDNKEFWKDRFKDIKFIYNSDVLEEKSLKELIVQNSVIIL